MAIRLSENYFVHDVVARFFVYDVLALNTYAQELIDGLDIRNELSHDYSGEKFTAAEKILREETFVALKKLYGFFKSEYEK